MVVLWFVILRQMKNAGMFILQSDKVAAHFCLALYG